MPHVVLARKWRPQRFEDVIGQKGVVLTLKNAIGSGRLAQAFIFAGPRGVGKTTTARILARALNCVKGPTPEPCGACDACVEIAEGRDVDVLEIDAATHTQVDNVRAVIVEPLAISPMRDRFKIFIIDEVHRLSKNAFDALLKSIEEPPPYVKFMMATTDLHAVPATIQSRSQIFELRALPFAAIRDQLKQIAASERVTIDDAALALVARSAEGSMRDALSALDQVLAFTSGEVTAADVSTVLGLIGRDAQFEIAEIVADENPAAVFDAAGRIVEAGFDLRIVCRELARLMRDLLVVKIDPARLADPDVAAESERDRLSALAARYSREDLMRSFDLLARAEYEIRRSSQPRHQFEMTLVAWIHLRKLTPLSELLAGAAGTTGAAAAPETSGSAGSRTAARTRDHGTNPGTPDGRGTTDRPGTPNGRGTPDGSRTPDPGPRTPETLKSSILSAIREGNKAFYGMVVAQAKEVAVEGDTLVMTFAAAHKSLKASLDGKRGWLEQLASSVAGRPMRLVARDADAAAPAPSDADQAAAAKAAALRARAKAEPAVQAVLDVFGGDIESVEELD